MFIVLSILIHWKLNHHYPDVVIDTHTGHFSWQLVQQYGQHSQSIRNIHSHPQNFTTIVVNYNFVAY